MEVAIVLSDSQGLPEPAPVDAELSPAQIEAMLLEALALAGEPPVARNGWTVIKPNIVCCPGLSPQYGPGAVTDLRIVRALLRWLRQRTAGRITIAEGAGGWRPAPVDGWTTDWNGAFGGLSYAGVAREFDAELLDLNFAPAAEHHAGGRTFRLAKAVRECDLLFSLSPLKTNKGTGVSLAMKNLFGAAPGAVYGFPKLGLHALGALGELVAGVFSWRPDAYAILGGGWGVEGEGDSPLRHNVLIASADAVAADTVASVVMGFDPAGLEFLRAARALGLGPPDLAAISLRGNTIAEARRPFRRPVAWADDGCVPSHTNRA